MQNKFLNLALEILWDFMSSAQKILHKSIESHRNKELSYLTL